MSAGCSCWRLDCGISWRDTRCWDPVSGRCGRCGLPYRRVVPLPVLRLEVVSRPVRPEDLSPTEVSDG